MPVDICQIVGVDKEYLERFSVQKDVQLLLLDDNQSNYTEEVIEFERGVVTAAERTTTHQTAPSNQIELDYLGRDTSFKSQTFNVFKIPRTLTPVFQDSPYLVNHTKVMTKKDSISDNLCFTMSLMQR